MTVLDQDLMALIVDGLEDWDQEMTVWIQHTELTGSPLVMVTMSMTKEEGAHKRAQNMEWVQMEGPCPTMALVEVVLEEMAQGMI